MSINIWANFFKHEKLIGRVANTMELVTLAQELVNRNQLPVWKPYIKRIEARRQLVNAAMDLGIDLAVYRVGRGLLDIWNEEYAKRYASTVGTPGWKEDKRSTVVTKLSKDNYDTTTN